MLFKMLMVVVLVGQLAILLPTVWGERKYSIQMKEVKFDPSCSDFFDHSSMELTKYNDTTPVLSGNTTLKKELKEEYYVSIAGYQLSSDGSTYETRPSLETGDHICDFLENDITLMVPISLVSNAPQKCPAPMGEYWIENFVIDNENLPDDRPGREKWRFDAAMMSSNDSDAVVLAKATAYVEFPNNEDDSERRS